MSAKAVIDLSTPRGVVYKYRKTREKERKKMALSIKDPEADELARQLASETGETITQALKQALSERLTRERRKRKKAGLSDRLVEIGQRCFVRIGMPKHSLDHGDLFYDEQGLPK